MITYGQWGLPKESGASDLADSPRLAAMMKLFDHPKAPDLRSYIKDGKFVRHPYSVMKPIEPETDPNNFSRDQGVPLRAGLLKQGIKTPKSGLREQNGDLLISPAIRGFLNICAGESAKWYHYKGLELELKYNAWRLQRWADKKEPYPVEQNQIISMCYAYRWLKQYKESTPHWSKALEHYWNEWREPSGEMSKLMIDGITAYN